MSERATGGEKQVAMVLGGAIAHVELVIALKRRGYHVIVVDYYANPPAKQHADEHVQGSAIDEALVLELARTRHAALVLCFCLDLPLLTAVSVSEQLGLPTLIGSSTARSATDKGRMKEVLLAAGVPTARHVIADDDLETALAALRFPVVVKPVDSTGSQGVRKAKDMAEALAFAADAKKMSRSGKAIVEEWRQGDELNVHCMLHNGAARILAVARKRNVFDEATGSNVFIGSITAAAIPAQHQAGLEKLVDRIARAFGIEHGPMLVQVLEEEGNWHVIEVAARLGGGMGQHLISLVAGADGLAMSLDLLIHGKAPAFTVSEGAALYATLILYAGHGTFSRIMGIDAAERDAAIIGAYTYLAPGAEVQQALTSKSRVGALIVKVEEESALHESLTRVVRSIDVVDAEGRSMLLRHLYDA